MTTREKGSSLPHIEKNRINVQFYTDFHFLSKIAFFLRGQAKKPFLPILCACARRHPLSFRKERGEKRQGALPPEPQVF